MQHHLENVLFHLMMDIHVNELLEDFDNQQRQINEYQHYRPIKIKKIILCFKKLKERTITPTPIPLPWIVKYF